MSRILVADDDPLMREMVQVALSRADHEVELVTAGHQALNRLASARFDAVVADIFMPGGTGIELLISMRAKRIDTPFICISGGDGDLYQPYASTMISLGASKVLRKPFTPEQLLEALASLGVGSAGQHGI